MRTLPIPAALLMVSAVAGCTTTTAACTPTTTTARRADKVDLRAASRSAVVEARLTAGGAALAARSLRFEVLDDGATVYAAAATTKADGTARVDLKRADPEALVALARADEFSAAFAGDGTYCASADSAAFGTVR